MQIVAPALEAAKYCIEKDNLRKMFANLISASMNKDISCVQPSFVHTLSNLTSLDAKIINYLAQPPYCIVTCLPPKTISNSIVNLTNLNLIESIDPLKIQLNMIKSRIEEYMNRRNSPSYINIINIIGDIKNLSCYNFYGEIINDINKKFPDNYTIFHQASLTLYGKSFMDICSIEDNKININYYFIEGI